jgi:hypothetical protein
LYLFECKNYRGTVSVDRIESFLHKVDQVSTANTKAVFMSKSNIQEAGRNILEDAGAGFIKVEKDGSHKTIFNKKKSRDTFFRDENIADIVEDRQEYSRRGPVNYTIPMLSYKDIECLVDRFFQHISIEPGTLHLNDNINKFKTALESKLQIKIKYTKDKNLLGKADVVSKTIYLNQTLINSSQMRFILLHELGHILLHKNVKIENKEYDNFKDSHYSFIYEKHKLGNPHNWIEWQANCFAECSLLRINFLLKELIDFQEKKNVRNTGMVYVDDQEINKFLFLNTLSYLSDTFKTTTTVVEYRLMRVKILIDKRSKLVHISKWLPSVNI